MAAEAHRIAPDLLWPAVADRYRQWPRGHRVRQRAGRARESCRCRRVPRPSPRSRSRTSSGSATRSGLFEHAGTPNRAPSTGTASTTSPAGWSCCPGAAAARAARRRCPHFYLRLVTDAQARRRPLPQPAGPRTALDRRAALEDCWGRALWGLGTAAARLPQGSVADWAWPWRTSTSAPRAPITPSARDGLRRAGRRRGAHPCTLTMPAPVACSATRPTLIGRSGRTNRRLAVARAPAALRQRGVARGAARRRVAARRPGLARPRAGHARLAAGHRDRGGHLSVTPVGGWVTGESRPGSTSSRSRSLPLPMPAPGRTP